MSVIAARQRTGSLVTLAAGVVAGAVGAGTSGADGVRAAAVGTVLVLLFLSAGALPLVVAGDGSGDRSRLGFLVLATTYALRLVTAIAVLTAASASGAVDVQVMGLTVIGLTGRSGGKLRSLCDHCVRVPSDSTARIQEAHITVIQIWCGILEDELFPNAPLAHG